MKACYSIISISLFGIILCGCQPQKNDPRLIEAHGYHQQAGKIRENLGQQLSSAEGDSLLHAMLEEFKLALNEWDEAFVEVPGFEHDHDHDHDHGEEGHDHHHHHHHNAAPNLSAQEHLDLQKHLLDEIKELEKSFNDQQIGLKN